MEQTFQLSWKLNASSCVIFLTTKSLNKYHGLDEVSFSASGTKECVNKQQGGYVEGPTLDYSNEMWLLPLSCNFQDQGLGIVRNADMA